MTEINTYACEHAEPRISVIKVETESCAFSVARDGNGNLKYQMEGSERGWGSTPLHATVHEFYQEPLEVAQRVSEYLDRQGGSPREEVTKAVLAEVSE